MFWWCNRKPRVYVQICLDTAHTRRWMWTERIRTELRRFWFQVTSWNLSWTSCHKGPAATRPPDDPQTHSLHWEHVEMLYLLRSGKERAPQGRSHHVEKHRLPTCLCQTHLRLLLTQQKRAHPQRLISQRKLQTYHIWPTAIWMMLQVHQTTTTTGKDKSEQNPFSKQEISSASSIVYNN